MCPGSCLLGRGSVHSHASSAHSESVLGLVVSVCSNAWSLDFTGNWSAITNEWFELELGLSVKLEQTGSCDKVQETK